MKKTPSSLIALFSIILIAIFSCKKTQKTETVTNPDQFYEYVDNYTAQQISVGSDFKVYLKKDIDSSKISPQLFSISPEVEGAVKAVGNEISFVPKEKLDANKDYTVTFHLSQLYSDVPESVKDFVFNVKTKELLFTVATNAIQVYDKNWNYIEGVINSSDIISAEKLPKILHAKYNSNPLKIKYDTKEGYASRIHFKIDSIQRFDSDKTLKLKWNGDVVGSKSKGSEKTTIIGKNNFKVINVDVINGDNQQIDISFSDPIKPTQNIKGLINFKEHPSLRYTYKINNNTITIYPSVTLRESVTLEVFKGLKSNYDFALKDAYEETLAFEQSKPSVNFIKSGTILPDSENLKINFQAVSLKAVDVTVYKIFKNNVLQFLQQNRLNYNGNLRYVGRPVGKYTINLANKGLNLDKTNAFAINLADIVTVESGAMYRVKLSIKKEYSTYGCEETTDTEPIVYGKKEIKDRSFNSNNNRYYYDDEYDYDYSYSWRDRDNPCKHSYYRNKAISTNVLATNLGIIVKKGNNSNTLIAVTDLLTTAPVANAKVHVYNMQKQELASTQTNQDGIAKLDITEQGYFVVVSKGQHVSYLRLEDGEALSMSKFDVSGSKLQKGIKGYIYGERGVWRPGDKLFLTFVLNDNANPIPVNHPIKFELFNPQGKLIERTVKYKKTNNMYAYAPQTKPDALTGNWLLKVSVGGATFNKTLKVETIKPNRLKIKLSTDSDIIKANSKVSGNVEVKWLHGAIAKNLNLDIKGKFRSIKTKFDKFINYNFDDITRTFETEEFNILDGQLNSEGKTTFTLKSNVGFKSPGMLKAALITKVYEQGGDFSTDVFTKKVSPYNRYVGIRTPEEKQSRNYLFTNKDYTFDVATVNENGAGEAVKNLDVKIYKLSWRWWWSTYDDNLSRYDGTNYHQPYSTLRTTTSTNGKGQFTLNINENDWGRYLIKVIDKQSGHTTSQIVYFDWPSWYNRKKKGDNDNATMLSFTTNKEEYNTKENIEVKFPSSKGARALITIENGTEVLDYFWTETSSKQTKFTFPALESYTPNVFVNISLLQKHSQTENDLPIRMYGSVPILVNNPNTKLEPQILLADEIEPEQTIGLRVQEKNAKPMTYTIALVDDGLLDLTRFKTPNPWRSFYAKQSLGVKTWDVFDDVVGAYGGKINQILSVGGDETEAGSKNKKANRFKPMVVYLGPFNLEAGATKTHNIKIPKYVGSVRAMVVASNSQTEAYGNAEKTTFVRKPVMVLASLPRKITPQETVTLPVTVFAMKPGIKNVKVSLKPDPSFTIVGDKIQQLTFENPDEKMAYFKLKVNDFKGIGKININAVSGREKASYTVEIDVLNPNPKTTETHDLVLNGDSSGKIAFSTFGTKGTNSATIELSSIPPINFTKRLNYLIRYPHGCVEQTTSSVFPQLYLSTLFDLDERKKKSIERNVKSGIDRLSGFQRSNGGMSYWPSGQYADDWGTSYAGHFLLEAEKKGYVLPIGFKGNWISYQKQAARNWRQSNSKYHNDGLTQAYRLYTLCIAGSPDLASMNRLRETSGISNATKRRLAASYAVIGKKNIALSILNTLSLENYNRNYYSGYGSETRNKAMSLETYSILNDQAKSIKLAKDIAERLSSNSWMSTQTTAYSLLAMSQFASQNGGSKGIQAAITTNAKADVANTKKSLYTTQLNIKEGSNVVELMNKKKGVLYARVFTTGILPVGKEKVLQNNLTATVSYIDDNGNTVDVNNLIQGTNFTARIRIKNTDDATIENVALTHYLPSGWEIVNTRFTDYDDNSDDAIDYIDIRDDRVNYYFTLKARESKTFRIALNASYLGDYYLPGVQAEAMYDRDYIVRTKGKWVKVVK